MKINILFIVFIFSLLFSLSIQIQENHYSNKLIPNENVKDSQLEGQEEIEETPKEEEKENEKEQEKQEEKEEKQEEKEEKQEEKEEKHEEKEEKQEEEKEKEKEIEKEKEKKKEKEKEKEEKEKEREREKEKEKGTDKPTDKEEKEEKTNVNIKCLYVCKYNIYSLQKLTKDNGYSIDLPNGKFKFNFCKNLENLKSTSVYTPKKNTSKNISQILFSGSIEGSNTKNEWSELEEDDGSKGLKIKLAEGAKCDSDKEKNHLTIFKLYCNDSISDDKFESSLDFNNFNENGCIHYIKGYSIYACALNNWYLLRKLMKEYNYIFASIFILLGFFLTFWGKKFETLTLMLIFGFLLCYIATIIILNFIPSKQKKI